MDQEALQKKYMEYQMLDQQIKQLQQQMEQVEKQAIEAMATIQSIEDFSKAEEGKEILVPVNNGIFAKAKLLKNENLLVNVGASTIVDKSIEDTKKLIEGQKDQLEALHERMTANVQSLVSKASSIEKELSQPAAD